MTANMYRICVALKLPESEFKGLLNFVRERISKHVSSELIYSVQLQKKSALVQSSKNTITPHTFNLK